jgi:outer membrane lipoprotein-sorting protein
MKKLVLFFATAAVFALGACTQKPQETAVPEEPVQEEVEAVSAPAEEVPTDSAAETPAQ